ncbi:MAG: ABC-F family ATP-binding cassette domain-containing protein [Eubacteriales bacterium]|nr:ABC-F family ATP-binding cassette domain-containing protein [Eubacteriales bacterium]MDD3883090.1 ABC-F family ATP-binding cassette domain-containing protein [Eubacteriales bacterium]MDD4512615.1 ABC-F family ATP-binding cassette domain-containing protein [Eubacteriales bacterium]
MVILSLRHIRKAFGLNEVLVDIDLTLLEGQRMGLVGVNGCGKTTLMRIIADEDKPDGGEISFLRGLKTGYLSQQAQVQDGNTIFEELKTVFEPLLKLEEKIRDTEKLISEKHDDENEFEALSEQYARLTEEYEKREGYSWQSRLFGVLTGLGFSREDADKKVDVLSGGERTRLCLAKLLLQKPDLLLLDEPTNHLDLQATAWLEGFISSYPGTVLIISHDRYFMDKACSDMSEMLFGKIEQYKGNYTRYLAQREERFEARRKAYDMQRKEIARQEAIIARFKQFNREKSLKRARSREKQLAHIEILEKPEEEGKIGFSFHAKRRTGEDVLTVRGLEKGFDSRTLFSGLDLDLKAGDRLAIIGPNGVGKSTLLKCLVGEERPEKGSFRFGANADIGYYDQHQRGLKNDKTILDEVWDDFPKLEPYEVRGALGLFLFSGDDVMEKIGTLSGGEKGRVALTKLMLRQDNILLLDEPTNHLDMDSREVLEQALDDFSGTIIAVSHDRYFINRFADKILDMEKDGAKLYEGNYDDYTAQIQRLQKPSESAPQISKTALDKEKKRSREEREELKRKQAAVKDAESAIAKIEEEIALTEAALANPELYKDAQKSAELARQYQSLKERQQRAYELWEEAESELNG